MLYMLLSPLRGSLPLLNVLRYPSFRMIAAALTSLLITVFLFPWFIRQMQIFKYGQAIRKDGPEAHLKKQGTPTMGGALVLVAILISTLLWADLTHRPTWLVLLVMMGYGAIGFYDDYKKIKYKNPDGLAGRWKLLWQFTIAAVALGLYYANLGGIDYNSSINLPFVPLKYFNWVMPGVLYFLFATTFVAGTSNAVNLTDGMDGLVTGPIIISTSVFLVLAYAAGTTLADFNIANYLRIIPVANAPELSVFCAAMIGACIGFLWYNTYPALIFMGDVGALALGGVLGMLAIFTKHEILSAILHGVFLAETLSVMVQVAYFKRSGGKRLFRMTPLHHHFEVSEKRPYVLEALQKEGKEPYQGMPESRLTMRFWIISVILAMVALASLKIR